MLQYILNPPNHEPPVLAQAARPMESPDPSPNVLGHAEHDTDEARSGSRIQGFQEGGGV